MGGRSQLTSIFFSVTPIHEEIQEIEPEGDSGVLRKVQGIVHG